MPDPKLQAAANEIEAILKKHDIAGLCFLASQSHTHFVMGIEPTWTCTRFLRGPDGWSGIHFRSKKEDFPSREAQKKCNEDTVGVLMGFVTVARNTADQLEGLVLHLGKKMEITHWDRKETL